MKEIRILHILPKMLSLYGEYGNVAILNHVLTENGHRVSIDHWDNGCLNLEPYDFIYLGSGTEDNLQEALRRLEPHKEAILASIDSGKLWLATGNAMSLFGKSGLEILPFNTVTDATSRFMGDVLTDNHNSKPLVGYVNTSCRYENITHPLFELRFGSHLGNDKGNSCGEGILINNFYGTQLIGPVLVKNPHFLMEIASKITGTEISIDAESYLMKAYMVTLHELQKRAKN